MAVWDRMERGLTSLRAQHRGGRKSTTMIDSWQRMTMRSRDLGTRAGAVSGRGVRLALSLVVAAAACACWCGPVWGLTGRGHVPSGAFAVPVSGGVGLSEPAGVAVDEASGDVYVVDRGNDRIVRFGPHGEFVAAWGWGVKDAANEYEICESGCKAGLGGSGKGQLDFSEGIAVDNSTNMSDPSRGDVYVVTDARSEHSHLEKFSANGEPLAGVKQEGVEAKWEGALDGVAVDGAGRLWVYRGDEEEGLIERFSDASKNAFEEPVLEASVRCPKPGFAVSASGQAVFVDHEQETPQGLCVEEGERARPVLGAELELGGEALSTVIGALDPAPTSALGAEPEGGYGDVYVDNGSSVGVFDETGGSVQRLALPTGVTGGGVAVDSDDGGQEASRVFVADSSGGTVDVFEPEPPGRPTISGVSALNVTASSAELDATIDPHGVETSYSFQYGTVNCVEDPSACTETPIGEVPAGFSDVNVQAVRIEGLSPDSTYYYRVQAHSGDGEAQGADAFGTITTLPSPEGMLDGRAWEMVSPAEKDGSGIEPLRLEGGLIQASEGGEAITYVANGPIVSEPEGSRAPYPTQALATRGSSEWSSEQIVTPRTTGEGVTPGEAPEYRFFNGDLSSGLVQPDNQSGVEPLEAPPLSPEASEKTMYVRDTATGSYVPLVTAGNDTAGTRFGGKLEFADATPDLTHVVFSSEVSLVSGASTGGLYEWQAGNPLEPVSVLPDGTPALEPALGAEGHDVRGALSNDGSRVIFTGESETPDGEETELVRHLYMRDATTGQTLQLDKALPPMAEPGELESEVAFQGASADGSRVFFTDTAALTEESRLVPAPGFEHNPADLYECEVVEEAGSLACDLKDLTVDKDPDESAEVLDLVPGISEDGSYVYFIANGVLAPGAKPGHCARTNTESVPAGATCSLYVWHEGSSSLIATLSDEDAADWGRSEAVISGGRELPIEPKQALSDVTAGVSPDGQYFAFMSDQSLTGYDNVDASSAAKGARDEDVYLYDAQSRLLVCASCNPDGAQPHGVFDTKQAGEGLGLLVDRRENWAYTDSSVLKAPTDHWLAGSIPGWTPLGWSNTSLAQALHQPRYLSDSGRLFFDSADTLIPVEHTHTRTETIDGEPVQVGVNSVYEYEPSSVGSCQQSHGCVGLVSSDSAEQESAFVDASSNGDDAFFVTAQPLVPQDKDTNFDLYDARVCTPASPCITYHRETSEECANTAQCRPADGPPSATVGASGSATYTGAGNQPAGTSGPGGKTVKQTPKALTRTQKLTRALKSCRRRYKQSRGNRAGCERQARRAYGPKKTRTAKHSASGRSGKGGAR